MSEKRATLLITGASSGVGLATASEALKRGYEVALCARNIEAAKSALADYKGAHFYTLDVQDFGAIKEVVADFYKVAGSIDILFNNAGYGLYSALEEVDIEAARDLYATNVFGTIMMTQAVLPYMRAQKRGKILNNASMAATIPMPCGSIYHSSKAAVLNLTSCLRMEVASLGIEASSLRLGLIATNFEPGVSSRRHDEETSPYKGIADKTYAFLSKEYKSATPKEDIAKNLVDIFDKKDLSPSYIMGYIARSSILSYRLFGEEMFTKVFAKKLEKY